MLNIKYALRWSTLVLTLIMVLGLLPARVEAQAASCAQDVIVQAGDTLSSIAARTLGSPGAYTEIVTATNQQAAVDATYATVANPAIIQIGWKLCVPASDVGEAVSPITADPVPATTTDGLELVEEDAATNEDVPPTPLSLRRTEDGPFPLTLDYLRAQTYPGSAITIEQTLTPGSNYNRYLVSYLSEGLRIDAYMTVPFGEKPATGWPVVVFNHGYIPPEIYRPTERYIAYMDAFARAGYILLRPDYRGHADSEGEATGTYGDPGYTIDVLNAVASIKAYPDADPARIGMWGHSMGGYITARAMVVESDIQAGVIWAGVVGNYEDIVTNWRRRNPIPVSIPSYVRRWRDELLAEFGGPEENPEFWASISANSYVADLSGPIQLHHGSDDGDVPLLFSQRLYDDILAADRYAEFYTYPGDDHNISANFGLAMQRSVEFMDRYVKNGVAEPSTSPTP